jgi:hypothetical protein
MTAPDALFIALTWKASLLVAAAGLAMAMMRRLSSGARHLIWTLIVASLLLLPALEFALPHYGALRIPDLFPNVAAAEGVRASGEEGQGGFFGRVDVLGILAADETAGAVRPHGISWLALFWLAGALFIGLQSAANYRSVGRLVRSARPVSWSSPQDGVRILEAEGLLSPVVSGVLRPVILFPASAAQWPGERRNAALAHELAHIRRHDSLIQIAVEAVRAIYWWNPFVHWALRRLEREREFACDDVVIAGGVDPASYATTLLASARDAFGFKSAKAALGMVRPSELSARCKALLDQRPRRAPSRLWKLCAAGACTALVAPLAMLGPAVSVERLRTSLDDPALAPLLDDARSELIPADYGALLRIAEAVPVEGEDAALIAELKGQLTRVPKGYEDLVRERAIWCLAQAPGGELVEPLIENLRAEDWKERAYAAWCLGVSRDSAAIAPLKELLPSRNWRVRAMATFALANIGGAEIAGEMAEATKDPAWQVRIVAAEYFGESGDRAALKVLRPLVSDPHGGVRNAAKAAVEKLRS